MKLEPSASPPWSDRTDNLISRCLGTCLYYEELVENNYVFSPHQHLPLVTFAHHPHDARSSCMVFRPFSNDHRADADALRSLGAPLVFFVEDAKWEVWSVRVEGARHVKSLRVSEVESYFWSRKDDFAPGTIFRAKTWSRATGGRQLDFIDLALLPMVEREAGARLGQLFDEMISHTMASLKMKSDKISEADGHWLMKSNFWLLAGKLLRDKQVPKFTDLDLSLVSEVFERVAEHYGSQPISTTGRLHALRGAANIASEFASLNYISTETLGSLYEETMVSPQTRKLLSVHRTPTYLVDYMIGRLSDWIEGGIDIRKCRVFEPACGHAPFLVGAVRMLSELLPHEVALDRNKRRDFLRRHISGSDRDSFALEIARLSLTLADIPNPNSWDLDPISDMFAGDDLEKQFAKASVIFVNPPFEKEQISPEDRAAGDLRYHRNGKAAELVRRLLKSAQPGTVFGIIVPQTILESKSFLQIRRDMMDRCEIREITVFSDKIFNFADVETAIILARVTPQNKPFAGSFTFRRVRDSDVARFASDYVTSDTYKVDTKRVVEEEKCRLLVAGLYRVWDELKTRPIFTSIATIGNGFLFLSPDHSDYPANEIKIAPKKTEGFVEGFAKVSGSPDTHLLPDLVWLNQKSEIIALARSGTLRGTPQVLLNHVRVSRRAWRLRAFMDLVGRPVTDAFLPVRPLVDSKWTVQSLWALCNSPVANAYDYAHSAKKHVVSGFISRMPVPDLTEVSTKRVAKAVRTYVHAAQSFTNRLPRSKSESRKALTTKMFDEATGQMSLGDLNAPISYNFTKERDRLRALHWRIDAEVLRLYAMPPKLERELLNYFGGMERVGVPFVQTHYIPSDFKDVQTLDDFLRITDEWQETDERRYELIRRELHNTITASEHTELEDLQRLLELREAWEEYKNPTDTSELQTVLARMRAKFKDSK